MGQLAGFLCSFQFSTKAATTVWCGSFGRDEVVQDRSLRGLVGFLSRESQSRRRQKHKQRQIAVFLGAAKTQATMSSVHDLGNGLILSF